MNWIEIAKWIAIIVNILGLFFVYSNQKKMFNNQKKLAFEMLYKPKILGDMEEFRKWLLEGLQYSASSIHRNTMKSLFEEDEFSSLRGFQGDLEKQEFDNILGKFSTVYQWSTKSVYFSSLIKIWNTKPIDHTDKINEFAKTTLGFILRNKKEKDKNLTVDDVSEEYHNLFQGLIAIIEDITRSTLLSLENMTSTIHVN